MKPVSPMGLSVSPEQPGTTLAGLLTEAISDPIQRVTVIGGIVCLCSFLHALS